MLNPRQRPTKESSKLAYVCKGFCTEILQYKETQAEATKLDNESISFHEQSLNTLTI